MMFNGEPGILGAVSAAARALILQQAVFGAEQYGLKSNDDTPNSRQPQGRPFGSAFERIGWVEENIALIMPPWLPGVASFAQGRPLLPWCYQPYSFREISPCCRHRRRFPGFGKALQEFTNCSPSLPRG